MRCLRGNISYPLVYCHYSLARSCKDLIAEMVHTRDGSRVAREFLARGTAKVCVVISSVMVRFDDLHKGS
jgi:hypothetical protein